jgi:hypothetical protein
MKQYPTERKIDFGNSKAKGAMNKNPNLLWVEPVEFYELLMVP